MTEPTVSAPEIVQLLAATVMELPKSPGRGAFCPLCGAALGSWWLHDDEDHESRCPYRLAVGWVEQVELLPAEEASDGT